MTRTRLIRRTLTAALGFALAAGLAACGTDDASSTAAPTPPSDTAPSDTAPASTAPSDTAPSDTAPSDTAPASTAPATGTVTVADQSGDGTTLTVASVELEGASQGWIAVHRDLDGKPGPVVGTVQVEQGSSTDVVVELDEQVATGAFWPMLHVDDATLGEYEFPQVEGADLPVMDGGMPVMSQITMTVG